MERLTHEKLLEYLRYNKTTGLFTWKKSTNSRIRVGSIAGNFNDVYVRIVLFGVKYDAQRLAWFYVTGEWPTGLVDHKDRKKHNNRWVNLRDATHSQNQHNQSLDRSNSNGYPGTVKHRGRYRAQISVDGKSKFLGYRDTALEASQLYLAAKAELHPYSV